MKGWFWLQVATLTGVLAAGCSPQSTSSVHLVGGSEGQRPSSAVYLQTGCGAVKVGEKRFLTAARCVAKPRLLALDTTAFRAEYQPGGQFRASATPDDDATWSTLTVTATHVPPQWGSRCPQKEKCSRLDASRGGGDAAIVEVAEATPQWGVAQMDVSFREAGDAVVVSGFGCEKGNLVPPSSSDIPHFRQQTTQVVSRTQLARKGVVYEGQGELGHWVFPTTGKGEDPNGASVCGSDAGSPVYISGEEVVAGVNSSGHFQSPQQDDKGIALYNLHTRLDLLKGWLASLGFDNLRGFSSSLKRTQAGNSRNQLHRQVAFADVDGEGASDIVRIEGSRVLVMSGEFEQTVKVTLDVGVPLRALVTGDFGGDGRDNVCVVTDGGELRCYGISTDKKELWWWFTQASPLGDGDDFVAGDFDGDGRDDLMVYNAQGTHFYFRLNPFFFETSPSFVLGNLEGAFGPDYRFYAQRTRGGKGRSNLIAIIPGGGVVYYASVWDGTHNTFWWAWTQYGVVNPSDDQVTTARIDDDEVDDLVVRSLSTGATRFHTLEYGLPKIDFETGQVDLSPRAALFFGNMNGDTPEPGVLRDDALVWREDRMLVRSDARWSGSNFTYWWAYTQWFPY